MCSSEDDHLYNDYNAFPDIIQMPNGDLLCVFYNGWAHVSFSHKKGPGKSGGKIMLAISKDSARTWSYPTEIINTNLDDRDPSLTITEEGTVMCTFFDLETTKSYIEATTLVSSSYDGGQSWTNPTKVGFIGATSAPLLVHNKELILPVYDLNEFAPSKCFLVKSVNNGMDWQAPIQLMSDKTISLSEPSITQYRGRLIAVARADQLDKNMQAVLSYDNGNTWTANIDLGFPGQAPCLYNYYDSLLLLAHRDPLTSLRFSNSDILEFSEPIVIDYENGAYGAYPSIVKIRKGLLLVAYYVESHEYERSEIRFKNVHIENGKVWVSDVISRMGVYID